MLMFYNFGRIQAVSRNLILGNPTHPSPCLRKRGFIGCPAHARGGAAAADPYTSDIKRFFDGEVIVGRDQARI
jgi:hypothetical protein